MLELGYIISLLFIIIFSLYLLLIVKRCPSKIKLFLTITLVVLSLRYSSILFLSLIQEQKIAFYFKELGLLNLIAIPLLGLATLYIFLRDEKRKFNYNYSFLGIIVCIYFVLLYLFKAKISIDNSFGFVVNFNDLLTPTLIYLIMIASIAVIALLFIDKPYSNKAGMWLLMISLMISIVELIIFLGGIKIFPYPLFGDVLMLFTTYKAMNTFKN